MAVEHIYSDESGTHGGRYCLVGGYRGRPGQWSAFNRRWRKVLADRRVDGAFHSREFFNRKNWKDSKPNQFVGWTDEDAQALLASLVAVISSQRLFAVGVVLDVQAFEALRYGERCQLVSYVPPELLPSELKRIRIRRPEPYMLCFEGMLSNAWADVAPGTELHFWMARHQQYESRAVETFETIREPYQHEMPVQLKSITPVSPDDAPGTQAADMLLYHWYRAEVYGGEENLTDAERATFRALRGKRHHLGSIDAAVLDKMLALPGDETRRRFRELVEPAWPYRPVRNYPANLQEAQDQ